MQTRSYPRETRQRAGVDYLVIKHCSDDENGRLGVDYSWYKSETAQKLLKAAESFSDDRYSVQVKWSKINTEGIEDIPAVMGLLFLQMSGTGIGPLRFIFP